MVLVMPLNISTLFVLDSSYSLFCVNNFNIVIVVFIIKIFVELFAFNLLAA